LSDLERRFITSLLACGLFGYAAVSCLVFYRRMRRRISEYKDAPLERVVHSPQYGLTMWLTGVIGVIGFAIASWQLVLSLLAILRGN
jgi:TRAP-type C4-dicarboxylate transport system permease small subunit